MELDSRQFAILCVAWGLALLGGAGVIGYVEMGGSVAPLSIIVGIGGVIGAISLGGLAIALVTVKHSNTANLIPGIIAVVTGGWIAIGGIAALQPWAYTGLAQGVASAFGAFVGIFGILLIFIGGISIQTRRVKPPLYACALLWCGGWIYAAQLSPRIMARYSLPIVVIITLVTIGPLIGIRAWSHSEWGTHQQSNHQKGTA